VRERGHPSGETKPDDAAARSQGPGVPGRLEIVQLEVGLLQNFCELIGCPQTGEAALVDPAFEVDRLLREAEKRGWRITTILITHTHDDHVAGLDEAAEASGAVVRCHPVEVDTVRALAPNVVPISHGEHIVIGRGRIQALHTPGHMPGCVCWYLPEEPALVTGDVLFVGSCGGVGYAASDPRAMYRSLREVLGSLPEHTRLYPGHDYGPTPTSTLAWEFLHNPAFTTPDLAAFCAWKRVSIPPG